MVQVQINKAFYTVRTVIPLVIQDNSNPLTVPYSDGTTWVLIYGLLINIIGYINESFPKQENSTRKISLVLCHINDLAAGNSKNQIKIVSNTPADILPETDLTNCGGSTNYRILKTHELSNITDTGYWSVYVRVQEATKSEWVYGLSLLIEDTI